MPVAVSLTLSAAAASSGAALYKKMKTPPSDKLVLKVIADLREQCARTILKGHILLSP